ncbi:hypothetical protein EDD30_1486 [Couchioplanes caeruleus]|uniref:Uncharacterized protein n=1 Tax=Couchioplanes caeruleus TaxID=56438 RepID=A0A3N1GEV9_9ACTN|nr:hypothetical protein EDD30_1486 [Couchioplanes caeruleus]
MRRPGWHTGRVPRVYHGDHTAHIRQRLRAETRRCSLGLVVAVLLAALHILVLSAALDGRYALLSAAAWWAISLLAAISVLGLVLVGVQYLVYRRRRPDLDAAGAEAMGERNARLHGSQGGEHR